MGISLSRANIIDDSVKKKTMDCTKILVFFGICAGVASAETVASLSKKNPTVGEDVVLTCNADLGSRYSDFGHRKKFTDDASGTVIELSRRNQIIGSPLTEGRYSIAVGVNETTKKEFFTLTIQDVQISDNGLVGCWYKDDPDRDEMDFVELRVKAGPESVMYKEYQDQTDLDYEDFFVEGGPNRNLKLTCVAKGKYPATHTLTIGDTDSGIKPTVKDVPFKQIGNSGKSESSWESEIVFDKPFERSMLSKYVSCQVSLEGFPSHKTSVFLQSKITKPHLMCNDTVVDEVKYGQSLNFSCMVNISPKLTNYTISFEDKYDGKIFIPFGGNYKDEVFPYFETFNDTYAKITLRINPVRFTQTNMKYTLFVANHAGHAVQEFVIEEVAASTTGVSCLMPNSLAVFLGVLFLMWRLQA